MARRAPTRLSLVHDPDVMMRLTLAARLNGSIRDEVKVFSISGDVWIGVLILAGERRNLGSRPAAVSVMRNEDGPPREIGRHFEKIHLAAIGREDRMRFVVTGGNNAGRKQRCMRKRRRRIVGGSLCNQRRPYDRYHHCCPGVFQSEPSDRRVTLDHRVSLLLFCSFSVVSWYVQFMDCLFLIDR